MTQQADLSSALRRLPVPEPNPELLQRILRSRALGRRFTAPSGEAFLSWRWIAAAAVVALLIGGSWGVSLYLSKLGQSDDARDQVQELLRGTGLWPSSGDPGRIPRDIPPPTYTLIDSRALDTSRLITGVWTYRTEARTEARATVFNRGDRVRLARATYAGQSVWMVSAAGQNRAEGWTQFVDTNYLDASSLRPLRAFWTASKGRIRIEQSFWPDSAHESLVWTDPKRGSLRGSMALPFPSTVLFLNDWSTNHLAVLFPAFRLARGWRGSLFQVSFLSRRDLSRATPLNLRVAGRERVTVPAGTFDCWRLEVESHFWAPERVRMWVSRDKGWLIKEQFGSGDYVVNRVLENYQPLE